jgi:hypothetical protein
LSLHCPCKVSSSPAARLSKSSRGNLGSATRSSWAVKHKERKDLDHCGKPYATLSSSSLPLTVPEIDKQIFLNLISAEHDSHVALLPRFIQAPSPNPPGDTAQAAKVLEEYLVAQGVPVRVIAPQGEGRPNLVADFDCGPDDGGEVVAVANGQEHVAATGQGDSNGASRESQRVVMNGHIDVFPVDEARNDKWTHGGPWPGYNDGMYIFGRGGVDMKAGTAASVIAFAYVSSLPLFPFPPLLSNPDISPNGRRRALTGGWTLIPASAPSQTSALLGRPDAHL